MVKWLKEEWQPLLFVTFIAIVGGIASGATMVAWFKHGVCW